MTKNHGDGGFRHLGIRVSFVIRHSSFVINKRVHRFFTDQTIIRWPDCARFRNRAGYPRPQ
jgi:hypothetical protein